MYAMQSAFTNPLHAGAEHEPARWRRCRRAARGRHVLGGDSLSLAFSLPLAVESSPVEWRAASLSSFLLLSPA